MYSSQRRKLALSDIIGELKEAIKKRKNIDSALANIPCWPSNVSLTRFNLSLKVGESESNYDIE